MKRFAASTLAILALLAAGVGLARAQQNAGPTPGDLEGKPAPALSLKTIDGKPADLAAMKGKVVLVDLWATWCPPCRKSLPHVQEMSQDKALAAKGLVVWAVNAAEAPDKVTAFLVKNGYTFTVPMDAGGAAMQAFNVSGIPTTVIIGRDGKVAKTFVGYGPNSPAEIKAAVEKALAEGNPTA